MKLRNYNIHIKKIRFLNFKIKFKIKYNVWEYFIIKKKFNVFISNLIFYYLLSKHDNMYSIILQYYKSKKLYDVRIKIFEI